MMIVIWFILYLWVYGMIPALVIFTAMEISIKYSDGFDAIEIMLRAILWPVVMGVSIYRYWTYG